MLGRIIQGSRQSHPATLHPMEYPQFTGVTRMKAKAILSLVVMAVLVLSIGTACNKASTRSDAQVASDVQSKIFTDPNVQSRQISVQSANGVVTLSGYVNSEAERTAAASAAAGIDGVK